jgi:exocyst complex component 7
MLTRLALAFSDDVITTCLSSLTTLARSSRRPAFGAIFLLNNVTYLHSRLLDSPQSNITSLLSKQAQTALESGVRVAKAGYFDANFSPLMQALADDRDRSKGGVKDKFTRFFDLFEEVSERHRIARVLEEDEEARETICEEVVKLVVPSLQRFTQKTKEKEFSKSKHHPLFSILSPNVDLRTDPQKCMPFYLIFD